ncbi:MAG: S8 family serine peptidase [Planctomycetes bacterium]|nr:S8 family serine peptidase [Planctomycetota bacterium]
MSSSHRGLLRHLGLGAGLFSGFCLIALVAALGTAPAGSRPAGTRPGDAALPPRALGVPGQPATGSAPAASAAPDDCCKYRVGTHALARNPALPMPAEPLVQGRVHPVTLAGAAFRAQVVENRLLARLSPAGAPADPAALERACAAAGFNLLRYEPALRLLTLADRAGERPAAAAARLAALPWVERVEPDLVATIAHEDVHSPFTTGDSPIAAWNAPTLTSAGIPAAWLQTTGSPALTMALLDTGVYTAHPEFSGHLVGGWDFVNGDADPQDDSGHGTAMAGLLVGRGDDGLGLTGVAWGCKLMPIKVADAAGNASLSDLVSGILFAVDHGAKVLNVSLGSRIGSAALADAVEYAWSHGALIVAAVGNDNTNAALYPAAYPHVVSVAATTDAAEFGYVTNISKLTTVAAPGHKLVTTIPGNYYRQVSGTSAAAALTSGVAALVWSKYPALTNVQVVAAIRYGTNPIPVLEPVKSVFRFGKLDAVKALARAAGSGVDVAVTRIASVPRRPMPGSSATLEVEVENVGVAAVSGVAVSAAAAGAALTAAPLSATLAAGERVLLSFPYTAGAAGAVLFTASAAASPGETELTNNLRAATVTITTTPDHAVQYVDIGGSEPALSSSAIDFWYTVRNLGNVPETSTTLHASFHGAEFGTPYTVSLPVGASFTAHFSWAIPAPPPAEAVSLVGRIHPAAYEPRPVEATGYYDFMLGSTDAKPVHTQYQQSGGVDFAADAPYRVNAGRPYLPLLIFVPDKGSSDTLTALTLDDVKIWQKTVPTADATGTLIYADSMATLPTAALPGLVIVDELGAPLATEYGVPDANLFRDVPLDQRGRHNVMRFPRSSLGIPSVPAAPVVRYYWVTADWAFNHHIMVWTPTTHGTTKKMLRVTWGTSDIAAVPLEGRYFDAHLHTIAEWHHTDTLDVFAPMKNHGGPLQMLKECAYAIGMTDSTTDVYERIVTTDHNAFYGSPLDPIPNSPLRRPPFGPTAVSQSLTATGEIKSEFTRMREIFGEAAGEEVAFSQNTTAIAPLPIGAHMLLYRSAHVDGSWHGGSDLSVLLGQGAPLYLETVLGNAATTSPATNAHSFAYCAHPFSGQGWNELNLNRTFGLLPLQRDHSFVSLTTEKFVLKGLQVWNGRGPGSLPPEAIDFNVLNPFAHPSFAGGSGWDHGVQYGLRKWHEFLTNLLDYNFVDQPGKKFARKIYMEAGTDAHGDFNYSVGRLATQIPVASTYTVDSGAFGDTRTYCFGEGKPGATVEKRALAALADGNSCASDGPVLYFDMDGDGRFNSATLKWHDTANTVENTDGRMGGGGKYDGERTMLVRKGNPDVHFRYLWSNAADHGAAGGALATILIYKDQAGTPTPTMPRIFGGGPEPVIKGVGTLAPGAPASFHTEAIVAAEEGLITKRSAFSLGGFTGGNPNVAPLGPNEYRCYTNPLWTVPVEINVSVNMAGVTTATPTLPPGAVVAEFKFEGSMMPLPYAVHIKRLDGAGNSTDVGTAPLSTCSPLLAWQWDYGIGIADAVYKVKNNAPIPLSGPNYPSSGKFSFVVYFKDAPKDLHGNALNSVAKTFTVNAPPPPPSKKCFLGALVAGAEGAPSALEAGATTASSGWAGLLLLALFLLFRGQARPRI